MTPPAIFILIAAISLIAIAAVLIPTILQIRQTMRKTEQFIDSLNSDVAPLCKSLAATASELDTLADTINKKLRKTDDIIDMAHEAAHAMLSASRMVRGSVLPVFAQIGGITAGIKTFSHFFLKQGK